MGKRRVLVVDDERELTRTLGELLTMRDYRVAQALTGEEALAQLARTPVDLVLLDLQLPGLSGLDVLARIRQQHPLLPVIVVTAYETEHRQQLETLGATRILVKPLSAAALLEALTDVEGGTVVPPRIPTVGPIVLLVVDPVEATGLALQQALDRRRIPGRPYLVEQVTSREQARQWGRQPDLVLINLDVLREGHTVAAEHLAQWQAGPVDSRPKDVICYGAATSEAAKRQLRAAGATAVEEVDPEAERRITQLAAAVERLVLKR